MKQFFLLIAFAAIATFSVSAHNFSPLNQPLSGRLFEGMTRQLTYDRMISPYGIEVSFSKTTHIIFPSAIRYIDLGSSDIRLDFVKQAVGFDGFFTSSDSPIVLGFP